MTQHPLALRRISILAAVVAVAFTLVGGFGVIQAPATRASGDPFPVQVQTANWSGLVAVGPSQNEPVHARVILPTVTCNTVGEVAMWVGYDGYNFNGSHSLSVEQDGVTATCKRIGGKAEYWLWYEIVNHNTNSVNTPGPVPVLRNVWHKLTAGDTVDMYVDGPISVCNRYIGKWCISWGEGVYLSLIVKTASGAYMDSWSGTSEVSSNVQFNSSECIVEAPGMDFAGSGHGLPEFTLAPSTPSPVGQRNLMDFQNCSALDSSNRVDVLEIANPSDNHVLTRVRWVGGLSLNESDTYIAWYQSI